MQINNYKILIRFPGDNDFITVMREFGKLVALMDDGMLNPDDLSKAKLVKWFNSIAPTLYEMIQAKGKRALEPDGYLTIEEDDIFLGSEVDTKMESYSSWGNGDSVVIDFGSEGLQPIVYSV